MLPELTQAVTQASQIYLSPNTPIIGENAFIHNAGLHVAAVLNDPSFYEVIPAELVGRKRDFILDKMASVNTIKHKLKQMNINLDNENLTRLMHYVKSKEKGTVTDYEIINILNEKEINSIVYQ